MRIAKFKEEEKAKKQAIKQAKKDAARARAEEEEKVRNMHLIIWLCLACEVYV